MLFRRKKSVEEAGASAGAQAASPDHTDENTVPRKKILVADDDPVVLESLSLKLKAMGYEVVTIGDASGAISLTRKEKPDLMLLDVNFPPDVAHGGMQWNGFLLTQWIRRMDQASSMPVIMMSVDDCWDYQQRAAAVGAAGLLPKSMHEEGLRGCINLALSRSAEAAENGTGFAN